MVTPESILAAYDSGESMNELAEKILTPQAVAKYWQAAAGASIHQVATS